MRDLSSDSELIETRARKVVRGELVMNDGPSQAEAPETTLPASSLQDISSKTLTGLQAMFNSATNFLSPTSAAAAAQSSH